MEPIRSFWEICLSHGLLPSQIVTLQALVERRRGVLHPYWIQIALFVPYGFAARLHDDLVMNEWALPDRERIDNIDYESTLSNSEIETIALIELAEMQTLFCFY